MSEALAITNTKHEARLQMLMEAEQLYTQYEEVMSSDTQKVFENKLLGKQVVLTIQKVAEMNN